MNPALFARVKQVHEQKEKLNLNTEQTTLLENTWKSFIDGGANLEGDAKERFKEISVELSKLSLTFDKNELAETNDFEMLVTDEKDLAGLPEGVKEMAAMTAKQRGKEGWVFTLHYPNMAPFMKYADNRALREQMYRANASPRVPRQRVQQRKRGKTYHGITPRKSKTAGLSHLCGLRADRPHGE